MRLHLNAIMTKKIYNSMNANLWMSEEDITF